VRLGRADPAVRNSDRKVRHGHTTKQGSPWVRWVLDEAAHKAKSRPPFAHFYAQCAARRGPKVATVAVAHKLLARAFSCPEGGRCRLATLRVNLS
jgi:transposase